MLRERSLAETSWEPVLPPELRELPEDLAKVDAILDQVRFLVPSCRKLKRPVRNDPHSTINRFSGGSS